MKDHAGHAQHQHGHASAQVVPAASPHAGHGGAGHDHGAMVADFRRRFWICLPLTAGVVLLSQHIQMLVGVPRRILLTPALGAALMSLSTIVVAINARPLGRYGEQRLAGLRAGMRRGEDPAT